MFTSSGPSYSRSQSASNGTHLSLGGSLIHFERLTTVLAVVIDSWHFCYIIIGLDSGTPVTNEYKQGARFNGKIEKVLVDLIGERHLDPEAEAKIAMKRQ